MSGDNKNLFTIGEIAKSVGITRKIILNYEARGLIKPDKKDGITGNRYYTIDTFTQIRTIRLFQNSGLSLDEIRKYFDDSTDLQALIKHLETMRDELNLSIEKLKERVNGKSDTVREITVAPQTVYCRKYTSASISDRTVLLRETALEAMKKYGTDTTRRMYFIEYPLDAPNEVSFCVAVPPESEGENIKKYDEIRALSRYYHGAYEDLQDVRRELLEIAKTNNLSPVGICRHLYIEGPPQHKDSQKFITQVILPVCK